MKHAGSSRRVYRKRRRARKTIRWSPVVTYRIEDTPEYRHKLLDAEWLAHADRL